MSLVNQAEPVVISYTSLLSPVNYPSLREPFLQAFGSESSLGLLVISDLPTEFASLRERCLRLACVFAEKDSSVRDKYVDASSLYSFGWSLGREMFNGKPDAAKGSYYAHPTLDERSQFGLEGQHKSLFNPNIWPSEEDCPGYRDAFKALSAFVVEVAIKLARAIDDLIKEHLPKSQANVSVASLIEQSYTSKARLLHYFPLPGQSLSLEANSGGEEQTDKLEDDLCSWHLDHSLLTGLVPAQYIYHPENDPSQAHPIPCPSKSAGLFIKPRSSSESVRASIPSDCLAFQTGEALQVLTSGRMLATPHSVQAGHMSFASPAVRAALPANCTGRGSVSRETMAVFLQPNVDTVLNAEGLTFGQFSDAAFSKHY